MDEQRKMRFDDGAVYERLMGKWSQLAGDIFLDWLTPKSGLQWVDIGCGNGVFTEMIIEKCAPLAVNGIDPSKSQLAYARSRLSGQPAKFEQGDAMALPFADNTFDVATMALVIFFVPDAAKGVGEMMRVVRPGGIVASYAWDNTRGGFTLAALHEEVREFGIDPIHPPNEEASRMEVLRELWSQAGLTSVETKEIVVQRTFADFQDFWQSATVMNVGKQIAAMASNDRELLRTRMKNRLPTDAAGRITYSARANAIKGNVP